MEAPIENSPREVEPSLTELSESILCPILQTPMQDPVMAADGHSYERAAIEQWISQRGARAVSPLTGSRLAHLELTPNITLKVIIQTYLASLPQRHIKNLSQQDLALAIKLREEELSNQLAKQHKQLEQLSLEQERLGPMAEQIERLKAENELLRRNTKTDWSNNNNNNSNNNSNNDNGLTISSDSDPLIEKHLSDIHSLSQQLLALNKAHAANMIKRLFTSRINRKKLKQTNLIQEEENVLHRLESLEQNYQKTQAELQRRLEVSLHEAESRLKSNLAEIGKKIAEHSNEEGDDEALEKLATERRRLRESHTNIKAQLEAAHGVEQRREEQKQVLALQEQKNRLQQIRASKASKKRELSRWADYTKNYTDVIEIQREKRVELYSSFSSQIEQLARYSKQAEISASKLIIAQRQRKAISTESAMRSQCVNQRAQNIRERVTADVMKELFNFTIRGQLEEVRGCLRSNRDLVHAQYDLTDLSERTFPKITGFQYAVWCGDEELWNIFLEFMTEAEGYDQLMALLKERPDIMEKHGEPLSFFEPLLEAYQNYRDYYNRCDWSSSLSCWTQNIGGAQIKMPAWFIYMFSEEGKDKAWPKKEIKRRFNRKSEHLIDWFQTEYNGGKCGTKFAFFRDNGPGVVMSPHHILPSVGSDDVLYSGVECVDAEARRMYGDAAGRMKYGLDWWDRGAVILNPALDFMNCSELKIACTKKLEALTERLSTASRNVAKLTSLLFKK